MASCGLALTWSRSFQSELSVGKESDEEDNEGARQRQEQLTALKEAAYELLGKAWPKEIDTQGLFIVPF